MSVAGLQRKPHYEEVLNAAVKDETSQHGILSVPLQRFATRAINSPLFQRVQATLSEDLVMEQKRVMEQRSFEDNVTRLSVDARLPREDLKWLVENLQQPPPPPPMPPPPPSEARVDYERMAAEVDGMLQRRAVETSHQNIAAEVERQLAAQAVATPAQQIIREHHHYLVTQPAPIPVPAVPITVTEQARHTGHSVHEIFIRQQEPVIRRPPEDIPITYMAGGRPPPPPPGGGREMVKSYGPAKLKKERMTPFQGGGPPPPPGGATAPMPMRTAVPEETRINRESVPIRREYFPPRRVPPPPPPPPPPAPPAPSKRKSVQQATSVSLKPYRQPRGPGHKLPDEPSFVPFSGRAQRLPDDDVVAAARQRMIDIARRATQQTTRKQDFARLVETEKKKRRGGAPGDVVALGKRKAAEPDMPRSMLRKPAPAESGRARQRIYGPATQVYNIAE